MHSWSLGCRHQLFQSQNLPGPQVDLKTSWCHSLVEETVQFRQSVRKGCLTWCLTWPDPKCLATRNEVPETHPPARADTATETAASPGDPDQDLDSCRLLYDVVWPVIWLCMILLYCFAIIFYSYLCTSYHWAPSITSNVPLSTAIMWKLRPYYGPLSPLIKEWILKAYWMFMKNLGTEMHWTSISKFFKSPNIKTMRVNCAYLQSSLHERTTWA